MDLAQITPERLRGFTPQELIALIVQLCARVAALEAHNHALAAENAALRAENAALHTQNAALQAQLHDVKAQRAQNSRNSSRPPSSDGYERPKPKSQRIRSGRKSGGQPGHRGSTLKQVAHPDEVQRCPLTACACGCDLSGLTPVGVHKRQVFELPEIKVKVIEYQAEIKACPRCGQRCTAAFPSEVTQPVQYGPRAQGVVTYLSQYQLLPYERLSEALHDLFALDLSQGTLDNVLTRAYGRFGPFEQHTRAGLIAAVQAHFDETGMQVNKSPYWLHVASTEKLTLYHIDERGEAGMQRMGVLPHFSGTAVHDHWASYFRFACGHALCNAHHLRELTFAEEEHGQAWAARLKACLLQAHAAVQAAKAAGATALPEERLAYFANRYSRILREGREELPKLPAKPAGQRGRQKQHKVKNLHDRLRENKAETLAFLYDFAIPFTNNQGERDARMMKVKQKISGCFRSLEGAKIFARVRGCISTLRKQGHDVLEAMTELFADPVACTRRLTEPIS